VELSLPKQINKPEYQLVNTKITSTLQGNCHYKIDKSQAHYSAIVLIPKALESAYQNRIQLTLNQDITVQHNPDIKPTLKTNIKLQNIRLIT
jgi:hypothetical protein